MVCRQFLTKSLLILILLLATILPLFPVEGQDPSGRVIESPAPAAPAMVVKKPAVRPSPPRSSARKRNRGSLSGSSRPKKSVKKGDKKQNRPTSRLSTATVARAAAVSVRSEKFTLVLRTVPEATVSIAGLGVFKAGEDGRLQTMLPPGLHLVRIKSPDFEVWEDEVLVDQPTTTLRIPLVRRPTNGRLSLVVDVGGAEIVIDKVLRLRSFGGEPVVVGGLVPGLRQIEVVKPGYDTWESGVVIQAGETQELRISLRPRHEPSMILIPASSFRQGNDRGAKDQRPAREVRVGAFEISRSEITHQLYKFFIDDTGHSPPTGITYGWQGGQYPHGQGGRPVVYVTWHDAMAFCEWLSGKTGFKYRLPTEAEWELAARVVGVQYESIGSVWEWCSDWYDPESYRQMDTAALNNPRGPAKGKLVRMLGFEAPARVIRGGGFGRGKLPLRVAERNFFFPDRSRFDLGFRVVREVGKEISRPGSQVPDGQ